MPLKQKRIATYSANALHASVVQAYDSFAEHWNITRQNSWYECTLFADTIEPSDSILDIGCGNGRLYKFLQDKQCAVQYTGIDNSMELIRIAQAEHSSAHFAVGDALALPYADNSFEKVMSLAVLHHITPRSNRQVFLNEVARVLKPGGTAFITVWNVHQPKYTHHFREHLGAKLQQYTKAPFNTTFGIKDCLIPFGEQKTLRYVHGFTPKELVHLVPSECSVLHTYCTLKDSLTSNWKDCRNICIVFKKR